MLTDENGSRLDLLDSLAIKVYFIPSCGGVVVAPVGLCRVMRERGRTITVELPARASQSLDC